MSQLATKSISDSGRRYHVTIQELDRDMLPEDMSPRSNTLVSTWYYPSIRWERDIIAYFSAQVKPPLVKNPVLPRHYPGPAKWPGKTLAQTWYFAGIFLIYPGVIFLRASEGDSDIGEAGMVTAVLADGGNLTVSCTSCGAKPYC